MIISNDYYCIEHGDCLEVMPELQDGIADMILIDPPYETTQNHWDYIIPLDKMWGIVRGLIKPKGIIAICCCQPFTTILMSSSPSFNQKGQWWKHEWVWQKNRGSNFANTVREPMKEHESVMIFCPSSGWVYNKQMQERTGGGLNLVGKKVGTGKNQRAGIGKFKEFNDTESLPELRVPSSIQKFNTQVGLHPTQKPIDWMRYLIRTYTNEDDTVLDFCFGSGTTGVACIEEKRKFIGIEKDETYFHMAAKRLEEAMKVASHQG